MKSNLPRFPKSKTSAWVLILPHLIFIAALIGGYYYIWHQNFFYNYLDSIYIGIKIIIACDIFIASIRTFLMPILALLAGAGLLYLSNDYSFSIGSTEWQLLIMSGVGFFIRFLVR